MTEHRCRYCDWGNDKSADCNQPPMTPDKAPSAEEIVKGLTAARRKAIIETGEGESRPYSAVHGPTRFWLFNHGLLTCDPRSSGYHFRLTPLGLQCRALLLKDRI